MKNYWNNLQDREKWLLGITVLVVCFYLLYIAIYGPLVSAMKTSQEQVVQKEKTLKWMQEVRQDYHSQKAPEPISNTKMLSVIGGQLKHSNFKQFPYQLQQTGLGDSELLFEEVPYNQFLSWLWDLNRQYAIKIKHLNAQKTNTPGVVKLTVVLAES